MDFLNPYTVANIPILELLRNLAIGLVIAVIWAFVIGRSTRIIVDTKQYLPLFLMLIPGMILIITIIKSSIALSLGLVGALSIVRFRTPIKEPEELLYIFIAIAVGLGLGANQVLATVIAFAVICAVMVPYMFDRKKELRGISTFADIVLLKEGNSVNIDSVKKLLEEKRVSYKIKRLYENDERIEALFEFPKFDSKLFEEISLKLKESGLRYEIAFSDNARVIT